MKVNRAFHCNRTHFPPFWPETVGKKAPNDDYINLLPKL